MRGRREDGERWPGFRWIRLSLRLAIYARDCWRCLACGRALRWQRGRGSWVDARPGAASLDHVTPKSAGGSNEARNLATLCIGCNSTRQARPIAEWRPDVADAIAMAVASPVDRALGIELARALDPRWFKRERLRGMPPPGPTRVARNSKRTQLRR